MEGVPGIPDFVTTWPEIALPFPGARGWLLQGEGQQVAFARFDDDVEVPAHSHREQWEFVIAGRVTLHIGGESRPYTAGDNFFIPAGVEHAASVEAGYQAVIVFNEADRYSPKT